MRDRRRLSAVHPTVSSHRLRRSKSLRALHAPGSHHPRRHQKHQHLGAPERKGEASYINNFKIIRKYWSITHTISNIIIPSNFNEKMIWRILFDRNPDFVIFSDNLAAKQYAFSVLPNLKQARILWQGSSLTEAPDGILQKDAFLKINNSSNRNIKLLKNQLLRHELQSITEGWKSQIYGKKYKQWAYSQIIPTLFIEENISQTQDCKILDIRVFMCSGIVTIINVSEDVHTEYQRDAYFNSSGKRFDAAAGIFGSEKKRPTLPPTFKFPFDIVNVCDLSSKLAGQNDHVRIDFMWNGIYLYFSEITVYSRGGYLLLSNPCPVQHAGETWDLRDSWFLSSPQPGWRGDYSVRLRKYLDKRATSA